MTELEEQLEQPNGDSVRQSLLQQLEGIGLRLRSQLQAGVPRSDYDDYQTTADAIVAAQEVLRNISCGEPQGSF